MIVRHVGVIDTDALLGFDQETGVQYVLDNGVAAPDEPKGTSGIFGQVMAIEMLCTYKLWLDFATIGDAIAVRTRTADGLA